ncbi:MAG: ABC transporter ATP-binding protein [Candidatus Competibacter sp.]|nr:ABC transporter ATP-binding protein [Candidatus Competibacter sp.]MDG4582556.1 ABC transporter ATP-binding protein [Candidatus Competibacter sp.]
MSNRTAYLTERFRKALAQLPHLPWALGLIWRATRGWTLAWAVLMVAQGLLPVAVVLLTRTLVDSLVATVQAPGDGPALRQSLVWVALMAGLLLLTEGLRSISAWVRTAQAEWLRDDLDDRIHAQAAHLDLSYYETPEYYDQLHRARVDARDRPRALLENIGNLTQNGLTLLAMAGILWGYAPWLPLVLIGGALPALWVAARTIMRFHRWRVRNTGHERRANYYDWMLTWDRAAAELRLFDLGDSFRTAYRAVRARLRGERLQLARQQMWAELGADAAALLAMGLTIAWMVGRLMQGLASLGDLALFYQVFSQGQKLLRTALGSVGEMYSNLLFLGNLYEFLALRPLIAEPRDPSSPPSDAPGTIRLEKVSFRYPGSQRLALDSFDLTLPAGQIVAIVGENGAGKSTLLKLLCRLYDPEAGRVSWDGIDLRELALADWRRRITVLFQEPVHYHDTVAYNIACGDLAVASDEAAMVAAAEAAGAEKSIQRLPHGYETVLGKWFGGAELSVGEWQRLALARAFLRRSALLILDEPTSAMDSWAEADWLARFRDLAAGRTALVITHRFTTALHADVIHVMGQGRILESGGHAELLARGGRYAQSWTQQLRETGKGRMEGAS